MARRASISILLLTVALPLSLACGTARRAPVAPPSSPGESAAEAAPAAPASAAEVAAPEPGEPASIAPPAEGPAAAPSAAAAVGPLAAAESATDESAEGAARPAAEPPTGEVREDETRLAATPTGEEGVPSGSRDDEIPSDGEHRERFPIRLSQEERARLRAVGPCYQKPPEGEAALEATRRRLYQTVCGAVTWFDGLFGERRDVEIAERTSGRLELSFVESQYHGFKVRARLNARVRFPNLEERLEAFVGRDDEDQFVEDRPEGFGIRSQFHSLEDEDRWVAGLGYGLPGSYAERTDFRLGAKGGRTPEIFAQGRHRRNWFVGDRSLWHFRETIFWTNRDGFGTTTSLDFDRILAPRVLLRLGGIGTFSEETDGVRYRLVGVVYQNLSLSGRALAYEAFARGETDDEVRLSEYGVQLVLRRPLLGKPWLFGELIGGYSWIRERLVDPRQGSYSIGFGFDLLFGQGDPY
jgi:hypothetical protein